MSKEIFYIEKYKDFAQKNIPIRKRFRNTVVYEKKIWMNSITGEKIIFWFFELFIDFVKRVW